MITIEQFPGLVGRTWPQIITSVNVMAGYPGELQIDNLHHLLSSLGYMYIACC